MKGPRYKYGTWLRYADGSWLEELALNTISYTLIRLLQTFSDIVLVRPEGDSPDDDDDTDFENTIGMVMAPPPGSIIELTPVST